MRSRFFVGTVPASSVTEAMATQIDSGDDPPTEVSDGELGDRANWVINECERRAELPELATLRRSRFRTRHGLRPLRDGPIYALRRGVVLPVDRLNTGHALRAQTALGALQELASEREFSRVPHLKVDIPGPMDLMAFTGMFQHYRGECESLLREIRAIDHQGNLVRIPADGYVTTDSAPSAAPRDVTAGVVLQLSIPLETYLVAKSPARYQPVIAERLCRALGNFIEQFPDGTGVYVHCCDGDKDGLPIVTPNSVAPLVSLANAICYAFPHTTHRLLGVHLPFGNGATPAPTGMAYYWALKDLVLPPWVALIAGIAQDMPNAPLDAQLAALWSIERVARREVVVSSPCGWGRRPERVGALLARTKALCAAPPSNLR